MNKIKELWENYKDLKWYWQILLALPLLLLVICIFILIFIVSPEKINLKILKRNKDSTDTFVENFERKEVEEEKKREILSKKQDVLTKEVKKIEEKIEEKDKEHEEILWEIDNAKPDQLKSLYAELRERGKS